LAVNMKNVALWDVALYTAPHPNRKVAGSIPDEMNF
jgi:hypothetical protein